MVRIGQGIFAAACVAASTIAAAAPSGAATTQAVDGCTATANLGTILVLSQPNQLRHPTLSTNCALTAVSVTVYTATNGVADFIDWPQSTVLNGAPGNWAVFSDGYKPGASYHVDDSYGFDGNFNEVPITAKPFIVKDASGIRLTGVYRSGRQVTVTGGTRQYQQSADYGLGGIVGHSETVTVQRWTGSNWVNMQTVTSRSNGAFTSYFTVATATTHTYRAVVDASRTVAGSHTGGRAA